MWSFIQNRSETNRRVTGSADEERLTTMGKQMNFARSSTRRLFLKRRRLLWFPGAFAHRSHSWNISQWRGFSHFFDFIFGKTRSPCLLASSLSNMDPRFFATGVSSVTVIVTMPVNMAATYASTSTTTTISTAGECSKTSRSVEFLPTTCRNFQYQPGEKWKCRNRNL